MAERAVRVRGAVEAERAFGRLADHVEPIPNRAAAEAAPEVVRARVPRRTGRLWRSVDVVEDGGSAFVTAGSDDVPYAAPINYGWPSRNIDPVRFLDPEDPATERAAVDVYAKHRDELVRQWDRETPG